MSTSILTERTDVKTPEEGVVVLERQNDGIAILRLGTSSERVVTLTERRLRSLDQALDRLEQDPGLTGVIVTGPGPGMFAAGADIKLIEAITDPKQGEEAATYGQALFGRFQRLTVPVVGAIEGPCLGGGYELALCFDVRVCSDLPGTQVGLPEVKLGIVPGFGGTQRLTRLLGLPKALDIILQGKTLDPKRAQKSGLVDRVVPSERLMAAALQELEKRIRSRRKAPSRALHGFDKVLSGFGPLRNLISRKVEKKLTSGQAKFFPAPRRALELCLDALRLPEAQGFLNEAKALGELVVTPTSKALVRLFFLTERSKKLGKRPGAKPVGSALVIGGGVMGAGIASLLAQKRVRTRLCDLDPTALAKAKARLATDLQKRTKQRRLQPHEAQAMLDRLAVSTEWGHLGSCELFLEAVVENLGVKKKLFAEAVKRGLPATAILASNTSSLPIDAMADGVPEPARVVGIHFFNPPEKMPLVEVIVGKRTGEAAVATACALAVGLGKFPIVVKDAPGFLVNRCLAPYLDAAAKLMLDGAEPEQVDRVALELGFPMGPARLLDEVGWDVARKVCEVLEAAFAARMHPAPLFAAMVEAKALGRKAEGGLYDTTGKKPGPGRAVLATLRKHAAGQAAAPSREEIHERLLYPMVDEAFRCLEEGVVESEEDVDLGMVMGIGFPPHTGGLLRWARCEGLQKIVAALDRRAAGAPALAPCNRLRVEAGR